MQRAANDDRENIGQLLRALQTRPSGRPYLYAWAFTAVWAVVLLGLAFGTFGTVVGDAFHEGVGSWAPLMLGLLAAFAVPVGFAFVLANMLRRSHELRLVGQSMAEIAMRLAEPEHLARDSIVNVSQAVRREVAAMGDGVERALARAAELEGLVNGEIATLERAYTENEVRIRGLLDTIATQRDTLISHAAEVKSAINSVHLDLSSEIGSISEMIANQVHRRRRTRHVQPDRAGRAGHAGAAQHRRQHDHRARRAQRRIARCASNRPAKPRRARSSPPPSA